MAELGARLDSGARSRAVARLAQEERRLLLTGGTEEQAREASSGALTVARADVTAASTPASTLVVSQQTQEGRRAARRPADPAANRLTGDELERRYAIGRGRVTTERDRNELLNWFGQEERQRMLTEGPWTIEALMQLGEGERVRVLERLGREANQLAIARLERQEAAARAAGRAGVVVPASTPAVVQAPQVVEGSVALNVLRSYAAADIPTSASEPTFLPLERRPGHSSACAICHLFPTYGRGVAEGYQRRAGRRDCDRATEGNGTGVVLRAPGQGGQGAGRGQADEVGGGSR